jgi:uncharacterized membrane protein (UPF0127 family)
MIEGHRGARALCLVALLGACERTDNDRKTAPSPTTAAPALARDPAPVQTAPTCVVPLPTLPPVEASPAASCPADPDGPPALPRGRVRFPAAPGAPSVDVEIARTGDHRQRGLMYRTELGSDSGMLFSWPSEAYRSFWMRNTCIPLDMLFIALDGTIVGILEQVPTLDDSPRRVPCPAAHVLEVNAGYVRAHGIEPGQRVAIDS